MQNIGIFGIGCIGSVLTKYFLRNNINNYFPYNRSNKNTVKVIFGQEDFEQNIQLETNTNQNLDWLVVCLKEYHIQASLPHIAQLISTKTKIAVFRNGLDLATPFLDFSTKDKILETIIDCPSQRNAKGIVSQLGAPLITLPETKLAYEFIELLQHREIKYCLTKNFEREQWKKLILSSSLGAIQALSGQPCSILKEETNLKIFSSLLRESIAVAASENIDLGDNYLSEMLAEVLAYPAHKGSSMLTDKLKGNQLELDAKIGVIYKKGVKNGVNIPTTQRIYTTLLKASP